MSSGRWIRGACAALALTVIAGIAFAGRDVHIPNGAPTGGTGQGARSATTDNAGGNLVIKAATPTDKDTSIHIWWYIYTPGANGAIPPEGGENGSKKEKAKDHDKKTECEATVYVPPGKSVHWVVAYDRWNKVTAEDDWTWGTEGTANF
ncbi:MAG: hypothetical protein K8T90_09265 [Planctomycetes bacterium]|nr:hypothetical protein [Planctomycetota bacterium]